MPKRANIDWQAIEYLASEEVISRQQLLTLGFTDKMIWERCRPHGSWTRLLPGVVMMRSGKPHWSQLLIAALRFAGPNALITGLTAAQLYGLKRLPRHEKVHLLVPMKEQVSSHGYVMVERSKRMPTRIYREGFPLASLDRAVLDGARRLKDRDQIRGLIAEAVQRKMVNYQALATELTYGTTWGTALPRLVLREISQGVRSTAEAEALSIATQSSLPRPYWNVGLRLPNKEALIVPDAWFDEVGLAWEIDSYEFHLSPKDYARTLARHATMTVAGIVVLHTLPSRLRQDRIAVLRELEGAYLAAASRPRPNVHMVANN